MKERSILFCLLILSIISCSKPTAIESALKTAGGNRAELEKVLAYYSAPEDSLKYQAACFLIENMPYHFTKSGQGIDYVDSILVQKVRTLDAVEYKYESSYINGKIWCARVKKKWDEIIEKRQGALFLDRSIPDCQTVTAEFLIKNIDLAFETLKYPWTSHLSFEDFCEYVLPYRFMDEPLEDYRSFFMDRYAWVHDSLLMKDDPLEVATLINKDLAEWFVFDGLFDSYPRTFSFSLLTTIRIGSCFGQTQVATYAMRAMGLAVARNVVPAWGNRNKGHDFSSVLSKDGSFVDFLGTEIPPGEHVLADKAPKIYRHTFSHTPRTPQYQKNDRIIRHDLSHIIDVTNNYTPTSKVEIDITDQPSLKGEAIFLCIFNNKEWVPITYTFPQDRQAVFEQVGRDIVYLPVIIQENELIPVDHPFLVHIDGSIRKIVFDMNNTQTITVKRKYHLNKRMIKFAGHMTGGVFQGANKADFSDAADLFVIEDLPEPYLKTYAVPKAKYRYVRYLFPPYSTENAAGNIAEIAIKGYSDNEQRSRWLEGDYIGIPEIKEKHFKILFDKKYDNYITLNIGDTLIAEIPERTITIPYQKEVWVGMDLKRIHTITEIAYCPRNDTNNLYEHCLYELFYWNNKWISLGEKRTYDYTLTYENVPQNALFLLRNHTEGNEERIFTYENGQQIWW